jgi:hypothetical protein
VKCDERSHNEATSVAAIVTHIEDKHETWKSTPFTDRLPSCYTIMLISRFRIRLIYLFGNRNQEVSVGDIKASVAPNLFHISIARFLETVSVFSSVFLHLSLDITPRYLSTKIL